MFCKNCGKLLGDDDRFCAGCGTKVIVEEPKAVEPEPMFFVEKREEPEKVKKVKKVIHLDEFNWDLDGYPTTPRKTEDVDFNWGSVLETKEKKPEPVEEKLEPAELLEDMPRTVEELLASLPAEMLEIVEEPEDIPAVTEEPDAVESLSEETVAEEAVKPEVDAEEPEITGTTEGIEEAKEAEEEEKETVPASGGIIDIKSFEQILEDFEDGPLEEPTRLIDKAQIKADSVDRFYVFSKKQAEFQNMLDQEYDRIQNGLQETEPVADAVEEPKPAVAEEKQARKLVAVVWSMPPAGIVVDCTTDAEAEAQEEEQVFCPEEPEQKAVPKETIIIEKPIVQDAESKEEMPAKEEAVSKEELSFADIFDDDEDEENEGKRGGCLKALSIVLCVLVVIELGILGIQYFAGDSIVAEKINQAYAKVIGLISGDETGESPVEEQAGPSEIENILLAQSGKNENIGEIAENKELTFEDGNDYGYEEFPNTYDFTNSPWYETEEGEEVTYGDAIIGTLIQYYSALPDKMNDVNKDVLDYVDNTAPLYEELEAIEGDETKGYTINRLEIGEIKTGQKGFYILVSVTSADRLQPEKVQQKQIVYLEAEPDDKEIKIKETKNI